MTDLPEKHHAEVVRRVEELTALVLKKAQTILNGLAARPKPGDKAKAIEAAKMIARRNYDLYAFMEGKKPLVLTTGDGRATFFDLYLVGLARGDEIDSYVEQWHAGFDPIQLHEFLGMTWEEYGAWVRDPSILPRLRSERQG